MGYAVVHMMKIKQGAVRGIQSHNRREKMPRTNPDIDSNKTCQNYDVLFGSDNTYWQEIKQRMKQLVHSKKAMRKDAVVLCNFVVTSDEKTMKKMSFQEQKNFFEDSVRWFANRYGADRIINATVHMDERTPHLHLGLVPITKDGRLSAKAIFTKKEMIAIQTEFVYDVAAKYGLDRGKEGSERKHLSEQRLKLQTAIEETEKKAQEASNLAQKATKIEHDIKRMEKENDVLKSKIQSYTGMLQTFQEIDQIGEIHETGVFSKKIKVEMTLDQANKLKEQAKGKISAESKIADLKRQLKYVNSIAKQVPELEKEIRVLKKELRVTKEELNNIKSIIVSSEELRNLYNEQVAGLWEQERKKEEQRQCNIRGFER